MHPQATHLRQREMGMGAQWYTWGSRCFFASLLCLTTLHALPCMVKHMQ